MKQNTTRREGPKRAVKQSAKQTAKASPRQSPKQSQKRLTGPVTIGMDLGDKTSRYCMLIPICYRTESNTGRGGA